MTALSKLSNHRKTWRGSHWLHRLCSPLVAALFVQPDGCYPNCLWRTHKLTYDHRADRLRKH